MSKSGSNRIVRSGADALLAALAIALPSGTTLAQEIDVDALVNDLALADVVYHEPATAGRIADAMEAADDDTRIRLHLAAVMTRNAYVPGEPVEVRLIARLRQLELGDSANQTAIWHVCRYPDRSCPGDSVIFLDETAYIATRPKAYEQD